MENEEERWAVHVDGIIIPGFNSQAEANQAITDHSEWKAKGAQATRLYGNLKNKDAEQPRLNQ